VKKQHHTGQTSNGKPPADAPLGLIAGQGRFPVLVAREAAARGWRVAAAGFRKYTSPDVGQYATLHWVGLARMGALIRTLKRAGVRQAVMAGGVNKRQMYSPLKFVKEPPDRRAVHFWYRRLTDRRDASILSAFADELAAEGIELISSVAFLEAYMADAGAMTRRKPTERQRKDIALGAGIARAIAGLDVGQSLIVKDGNVVAVEAVEGTDDTIRRGGALARGGAVLVKFSRPNQDFRFDVPVVGVDTVSVCQASGVAVIAIEAGRVLMLDKADLLRDAKRAKIAVYGVTLGPTGAGSQ